MPPSDTLCFPAPFVVFSTHTHCLACSLHDPRTPPPATTNTIDDACGLLVPTMNAWKQHVEYIWAIRDVEKRLERKEDEILAHKKVRPAGFPTLEAASRVVHVFFFFAVQSYETDQPCS